MDLEEGNKRDYECQGNSTSDEESESDCDSDSGDVQETLIDLIVIAPTKKKEVKPPLRCFAGPNDFVCENNPYLTFLLTPIYPPGLPVLKWDCTMKTVVMQPGEVYPGCWTCACPFIFLAA